MNVCIGPMCGSCTLAVGPGPHPPYKNPGSAHGSARLSVHTSKIVKWSIKVINVFERSGTSYLFIKLKLGRVGMGRVLHLGPSWHGPSFMWAELAWAELVLGRVVLHPFKQV